MERKSNFVITYRGKCHEPLITRIKSILGDNGFDYTLPIPPYEVKVAILENYMEKMGIEPDEDIIELLLKILPDWPQPFRAIDLIKTHYTLQSEKPEKETILNIIRKNFQSIS